MKPHYLTILFFASLLFQSCLTDIRPKSLRNEQLYTEESHQKAVALLEKYANNAGLKQWTKVKTYEVDFSDDFFGFRGKFAHPYPSNKNLFHLKYIASESFGNLEFKIGDNINKIWGYSDGITYTKETQSSPSVIKRDKNIKFWLPTYQYFMEFPFRIPEAEVMYYLETRKYGLNNYDLVLVSWKTAKPQKMFDQYLLWINQSTGLVDKFQFTIREIGGIYKGTAIIDEYQNFNGIMMPSLIKIYTKENSTKPLHIMRVFNFHANRFNPEDLIVLKNEQEIKKF